MIDTSALRGAIYKVYKSQTNFSHDVEWPKNKIGRILNGKSIPSIDDCRVFLYKLKLSDIDYKRIFLPNPSPYGDNEFSGAATPIKTNQAESNQTHHTGGDNDVTK